MGVLAISGSPRRGGNTDYLLNVAVQVLSAQGIPSRVLALSDYDIRPCDGCLACEAAGCMGYCSISDDLTEVVMPEVMSAQAILLGTPAYFDLPTGHLKLFMDRSNMALSRIAERAIPYGLIVVGQSELASLRNTASAVQRYCQICGMEEVPGSPVMAIGRDPGDVGRIADAIAAAETLAAAVVRALR